MNFSLKRKIFSFFIAIDFGLLLFLNSFLTAKIEVSAAENAAGISDTAEASSAGILSDTAETNRIDGWPQGPEVSAEAAILIEANTGAILYEKNVHDHHYPASITKILTAYIARQNSDLKEVVEYSSKAVNSINWREDSNIGIKAGESLTMEQSLYSLLVGSANECGNAIGEHISGSMEAFAELMNQTAQEIGCVDSHFVTTNGIHDENHYTSAYDMAQIARKFFSDELLCKMSSQTSYEMPASSTLSQDLLASCKNQLLPGRKYAYEYLVGSKTGYTDLARQNLVSCAEKDGLKLICVVMKDEAPMQYTDTVDLFNYGFSNFKTVNVSENDTTYSVRSNSFFTTENDIFGNSTPILSLDSDACLILPADADFKDVTSELSYENLEAGQAAMVYYYYKDQPVGKAAVLFSSHGASFDFEEDETAAADDTSAASADGTSTAGADDTSAAGSDSASAMSSDNASTAGAATDGASATAADGASAADADSASASAAPETTIAAASLKQDAPLLNSQNIIYLNLRRVLFAVLGLAVIVAIGFTVFIILRNRRLSRRRRDIMRRRRRKKNKVIDFDRYDRL